MAYAQGTTRGPQVVAGDAGKTLKFSVAWRNPTVNGVPGEIVNSDDYTARLQIRDAQNSRRVILDVLESTDPEAVLSRYLHTKADLTTEERFLIFLNKSYTSWMPDNCVFECELVNNDAPDDVVPLFTLMVKINPQEVI